MNKHYILCLSMALVLLSGAASAQVPGYMGRKTALMVHVLGWPGGITDSYSYSYKYDGTDGLYMKYAVGAGVDRVVSRPLVLSLFFESFRMGSPGISWGYYPGPVHIGRDEVQALGGGIALKTFPFLKKGRIAPIGPYFRVEWRTFYLMSHFVPDADSDPTVYHYNTTANSFSIGPGYCNVIKNRILVDLGIRLSLSGLPPYSKAYSKYKNEMRFWDTYNFLYNDILKFRLGLGVLLGK